MKNFTLLALVCQSFCLTAQVSGGQQTFQFMMLPASARLAALGGMQVAVRDDDVAFATANPAALNSSMSGRLTFQHSFFLADLQNGYAGGAWQLQRLPFVVHGGVQYMKYGEIKRADQYGDITGTVQAGETALTAGAARPLGERLQIGLNLRLAFSTLDAQKASAIASDLGFMYADTARRLTVGLVLRNAGTQMKTYYDRRENIPFDIQLGFSKKLAHLPFRFGVVAHHLHQWDIRYNDPNGVTKDITSLDGQDEEESKFSAATDNFFRHFIFNGEFLLGKNEGFRLLFAYNHLRKRELSVSGYRSLAGFSGGIGLKINRFRIDAGYASYHLGGSILHVGIGTNLKDFF